MILDRSGKLRFLVENVGIGPAFQPRINLSVNGRNTDPDNFSFYILRAGERKTFDFHAGFQPTRTSESDTENDEPKARAYYKNNPTTVNVAYYYRDIFENNFDHVQPVDINF
jgi:hypothetical protein